MLGKVKKNYVLFIQTVVAFSFEAFDYTFCDEFLKYFFESFLIIIYFQRLVTSKNLSKIIIILKFVSNLTKIESK